MEPNATLVEGLHLKTQDAESPDAAVSAWLEKLGAVGSGSASDVKKN